MMGLQESRDSWSAGAEKTKAIEYAHWGCRMMFNRMFLRFCLQEESLLPPLLLHALVVVLRNS